MRFISLTHMAKIVLTTSLIAVVLSSCSMAREGDLMLSGSSLTALVKLETPDMSGQYVRVRLLRADTNEPVEVILDRDNVSLVDVVDPQQFCSSPGHLASGTQSMHLKGVVASGNEHPFWAVLTKDLSVFCTSA